MNTPAVDIRIDHGPAPIGPSARLCTGRRRCRSLVPVLTVLVALVGIVSAGPAHAQAQGDVPVVGAWTGGSTTAGVVRDGQWLLRFEHASGPHDAEFWFGRATDEPITGDWNGDGRMTVGVRRGSRFFLRNSNSGGAADEVFHYGREGDAVLAGDWNDSGTTTVGVRREDRFLLRNSNSSGSADLDYHFGRPYDPDPEPDPDPDPDPEPTEEIVASFTTPLVPGQDRNVNIQLAADYIDGHVITPGASYSLNHGIGPRTRARGFVENGYIDADGEVISVVGGGVSQMGTTFLNAAWFAGIQIDEFRQHTIYFERYPMCREATLAWDLLDVVITNDSPHAITVRTAHSSQSVTVSFVSIPWAEVDSWTGSPYGWVGESFRVDCGRTITYPDGTTSSESYSWRYDETG